MVTQCNLKRLLLPILVCLSVFALFFLSIINVKQNTVGLVAKQVIPLRSSRAIIQLNYDVLSHKIVGVGADGIVASMALANDAQVHSSPKTLYDYGDSDFIAFSKNSKTLITRTQQGKVFVSGKSDKYLSLLKSGQNAFVSHDGSLLALSQEIHPKISTVTLVNLNLSISEWKLRLRNTTISRADFAPDDTLLAIGFADGEVMLTQTYNGKCAAKLPHLSSVTALEFSDDSRLLAVGTKENGITVWDISEQTAPKKIARVEAHDNLGDYFFSPIVSSVVFTHDKQYVVGGSYDGMINVWHIRSGRNVARFMAHPQGVTALLTTPDNQTIISGGYEGWIKIWEFSK